MGLFLGKRRLLRLCGGRVGRALYRRVRQLQFPVRGRDEADPELEGQRRRVRLLRRLRRVAEEGLGAADETVSRGESEEAGEVSFAVSEHV